MKQNCKPSLYRRQGMLTSNGWSKPIKDIKLYPVNAQGIKSDAVPLSNPCFTQSGMQ